MRGKVTRRMAPSESPVGNLDFLDWAKLVLFLVAVVKISTVGALKLLFFNTLRIGQRKDRDGIAGTTAKIKKLLDFWGPEAM